MWPSYAKATYKQCPVYFVVSIMFPLSLFAQMYIMKLFRIAGVHFVNHQPQKLHIL